MVFRLLALILLPLLAYGLVRSIHQRFALSKRQTRLLVVLITAVMVITLLIIMGRLPIQFILAPIGVAVTFLLRMLPTLLRLLPMWQMLKSRTSLGASKSQGQTSTIRTEYLAMELQHDSGDMDGVVLKGSFSKKRLSGLSAQDLLELLKECNADSDSSQVLQAYLDRNHPDWREQAGQAGSSREISDDSQMTEALALEILGLAAGASNEQVIKAHRNLMQKMHPDRGGSDYLAKKINAAKDFLLGKTN